MQAGSFKVYPKRNLVSINWQGAPSVQDWYDVQTSVIPDYVRNVPDVLEHRASCISPATLAVVAPAPSDYGMARMMETLSDTATVDVRAFKRPRDAMEWLKNPVPFRERSPMEAA